MNKRAFINALAILLLGSSSSTFAHDGGTPSSLETGVVQTENRVFLDQSRNRSVPVELYYPLEGSKRHESAPLIILNHGYRAKNTEYSCLAKFLTSQGYFVISIQHELPSDEPLATTGSLYERRKPVWERGVQNILFILSELKKMNAPVDFSKLTLIGHSNGGNISMLFGHSHPEMVHNIISLDSLRMPFPQNPILRILSLRASDTKADEGVIPDPHHLQRYPIEIIPLDEALHIEFCDRGPAHIKEKMNDLILQFLQDD